MLRCGFTIRAFQTNAIKYVGENVHTW
jgi:hypothetical protein